jgi:hypothetical protein
MDEIDRYLRLGLKAQSQCRATLETLVQIKNPPVVVARQANIAAESNESKLKEARGTVKLAIHPSVNAAMVIEKFGDHCGCDLHCRRGQRGVVLWLFG